MGQTVALYSIDGVSKAKTAKAILVFEPRMNKEAWIPLTVASVRFVNKTFGVRVTVPGWFFGKIQWKEPSNYVRKAAPAKPANPYIGADVGNMMEERMVLEEIVANQSTEDNTKLIERIKMIDEAVQAAYA